jgi:valyl-tRNA synthetase
MEAVTGIRSIRGELNIPPTRSLKAVIKTLDNSDKILTENLIYITKLANAMDIEIGRDIIAPRNAATVIRNEMEIFIPLKGLIDVDTEMKRLRKEMTKLEESISIIQRKLKNENFVKKAPKAVVEANRVNYNELNDKKEAIQSVIDKLKNIEAEGDG